MTERPMTQARMQPQARVIPLRLMQRAPLRPAEAAALFRTSTRTIRPIEVVLLSPILIPFTVVVLLALLAWFVLWLAAVGMLFAANLISDIARAILWRCSGALLRTLDRRAISFQGR